MINGELVERDRGAKANRVAGEVFHQLRLHITRHSGGWAFPGGTGLQCFPDDPGKVRRTDACYVAAGRFENNEVPEGLIRLAPDLVVEVVSPNDSYYEVELKVDEYLDAGVRLVWVIAPSNHTAKIDGNDGSVSQVDATAQLSGDDVLPGLNCQVGDLFPRQAM